MRGTTGWGGRRVAIAALALEQRESRASSGIAMDAFDLDDPVDDF